MINPFEAIVAPDPGSAEELGGMYECKTCFKISNDAHYFEKTKLLIWECPEGHRNVLEGVEID